MIFLLNREYVVWEVVELTRLHICEVLRLTTDKVEAKIDLAGDTLSPEFQVDLADCPGVTPEQIKDVMRHTYADCKEELERRLGGLPQTRAQVQHLLHGGVTGEGCTLVRNPTRRRLGLVPLRLGSYARRVLWRVRDAHRWIVLSLVRIGNRLIFWS